MNPYRVALFAIVVLLLVTYFVTEALSHEAASGWVYPPECCSGVGECRELQRGEYVPQTNGWDIRNAQMSECKFEFVPTGDPRIKTSGDDRMHACFVSHGCKVRCIYEKRNRLW